MKAISAAIIVLAGVLFTYPENNNDAAIIGLGLMVVGFVMWIREMGRREE